MKKIICTMCLCAGLAASAQPLSLNLHDGWELYSTADPATRYAATVPSTAMGVLMDNGALPADLLDGLNYRTVDRTRFDVPWVWATTFALPADAQGRHVALELDGVSYRADVWLNGTKVASADTLAGPFRRHTVDVTPYAKDQNRLEIVVSRGREGEPNIGFVDWNPRPADESMGVFRPVRVHVTDRVELSRPAVKSKVNTATLAEADLTLEATLTNHTDAPVAGVLRGTYEGGEVNCPVALAPRETRTVSLTAAEAPALHVDNPRLWWSRGMGSPEMYAMDLEFVADGRVCDAATVNFGIREVEDYFTPEGHRGFRINGRPVLVRSAGWTDDIFLRNDSVRNEIEVGYVADMNLNSIRFENVWGTSEHVYDLCDRHGLLVFTGWSCHWEWENYLGTPCDDFGGIRTEADMDLIARSLADQVAWLRNHPSIVAWFTGSDMMPRPELERRYIKALEGLDSRPCITAAKAMTSEISGPSGTKMAGPYEYVAPCYWYAPEAPGGAFGWNTETGIGAQLPQKESLRRMIPADKLWPPTSEEWSYHCTTSDAAMNSMDTLLSTIAGRMGEARGFDDFVRKGEWINYDGTRTMFEAFRARIPAATGIVQWMLNSAWPSLYWQVYDHYLVPTSAYYSLRRSNAPVQLIYDYGRRAVVAVNETGAPVRLTARMSRYADGTGAPVQAERHIAVEPYTVAEVFDVARPDALDYMFLSLADDEGAEVARNFYVLAPSDDVHDWAKSDWVSTPVARHADFSALMDGERVMPQMDVVRDGDTLHVTLHNASPRVSFFNRLAAKDASGSLIVPARWSDNYVSLQPGETLTLTCALPAGTPAATVELD